MPAPLRLPGLLLLLFCLSATMGRASHLMGGTVYHEWLGDSTYRITFVIYRDCKGTEFPDKLNFYLKARGMVQYGQEIKLDWGSITTVTSPITQCMGGSANYCIQKAEYTTTITVASNETGYDIHYSLCCRNAATANIGSSDMSWAGHIPPNKYEDSSPMPVRHLTPTICAKRRTTFNMGIFDPDGDSLVFSLVTPFSITPYPANYKPGYSVQYPFGTTSPPAIIDAVTGDITLEPQNLGNYVLAIDVSQYRFNPLTKETVYLGSMRTDLQFIVTNCGNISQWEPSFKKDPEGLVRTVYPGELIKFEVTAIANPHPSTSNDFISMEAMGAMVSIPNFTPPKANLTIKQDRGASKASFEWQPTCDHITFSSPHLLTFRITDEHCHEAERTYSIYVVPPPYIIPPRFKCLQAGGGDTIHLSFDPPLVDREFQEHILYRSVHAEGDPDAEYVPIARFSDPFITTFVDTANLAEDGNGKMKIVRYFFRSVNRCGLEGYCSDTFRLMKPIFHTDSLKKNQVEWDWMKGKSEKGYLITLAIGGNIKVMDTVKDINTLLNFCPQFDSIQISTFSMEGCSSVTPWTRVMIEHQPPVRPVIAEPEFVEASTVQFNIYPATNHKQALAVYTARNEGNFLPYKIIPSQSGEMVSVRYTNPDLEHTPFYFRCVTIDTCGFYSDHSNTLGFIPVDAQYQQAGSVVSWKESRLQREGIYNYTVSRLSQMNWMEIGESDTYYYEDIDVPANESRICYNARSQPDTFGASMVVSHFACVSPTITVFVPNSFTPSGSANLNNFFGPVGNQIDHYQIQIFSRWGTLVYANDQSQPWDGRYRGDDLPEGLYLYRIRVAGLTGEIKFFDGTLHLLRSAE